MTGIRSNCSQPLWRRSLLHSRSSLGVSTQVADFQIVSQSNKTNAFGDVVHVLMVNSHEDRSHSFRAPA